MRQGWIVVAVLGSGCGAVQGLSTRTPAAPAAITRELYPHEIEYELLTQVRGESCADADYLEKVEAMKSPDPAAIPPEVLFERAKYDALDSILEADVLLFVRARAFEKGGRTCVAVIGRAARAQTVRAVGASVNEERRELPPSTRVQRSHAETLAPSRDD